MTLLELVRLVRKRWALIVMLPCACALATAAYCWLVLPNEYTATVSMYVLAQSGQSADENANSELAASQMLTNDVAKILVDDRVRTLSAQAVGLSSLDEYDLAVSSDTSSRVITLNVTGKSDNRTAGIANALVASTDKVARDIMKVQSVTPIADAQPPREPSGPPRALYTAAAFALGLLAAVAISIALELVNTRVRSGEEAEALLGLPIIGRLPACKE